MAYGNDEVATLTLHFGNALSQSESDMLAEWASFRQFMIPNWSQSSMEEVLLSLSSDETRSQIFPCMSELAKICRVIPVHTSTVERTFSQLKLIKTRIRNRMKNKTLDALLRIATERSNVEKFPFEKAVNLWGKKKKRRITQAS